MISSSYLLVHVEYAFTFDGWYGIWYETVEVWENSNCFQSGAHHQCTSPGSPYNHAVLALARDFAGRYSDQEIGVRFEILKPDAAVRPVPLGPLKVGADADADAYS